MELGKTKGLDLPVAHETEKKILFLLLSERKDPAPIQYLLSALKDEDFFIPVHLQAFKLIKNYITEHGLISDLGLFLDWLQTQCRDKAQYVKLMAEISKILDTQYLPLARYFDYCRRLKEFAAYRKLRYLARDILDSNGEQDIEQQILAITSELKEVQRSLPGEQKIDLASLLEQTRKTYATMLSDDWTLAPIVPTGFSDLDGLIGGWRRGEYIIIGGLPGIGKTTFALQIALSQAFDGHEILFVSIEMTDEEMGAKIMKMESDSLPDKIFIGKYKSQKYLQEMDRVIEDHQDLPFKFCFGKSLLSQIISDIERTSLREEIDIVYIDYFQRIRLDSRRLESKQQEYAEISHELSNLAKRLKIPIVVLSQLRREVGQKEREPRLQDLKETGAIEQDADKVLFLHRESYFNPRIRNSATEVIIAKVRGPGDTGRIKLLYHRDRDRYQNYEETTGERQ